MFREFIGFHMAKSLNYVSGPGRIKSKQYRPVHSQNLTGRYWALQGGKPPCSIQCLFCEIPRVYWPVLLRFNPARSWHRIRGFCHMVKFHSKQLLIGVNLRASSRFVSLFVLVGFWLFSPRREHRNTVELAVKYPKNTRGGSTSGVSGFGHMF